MATSSAAGVAPTQKRSRGIDRLIEILKYLHQNGQPQRPNEIAAAIGAPKSTVYEIVNRLTEERILEPFDKDGRLFLGRTLHFFGTRYLEKFDLLRQSDLIVAALSEETGETAQLCMIDGKKFIVALAHAGNRHFKISSEIGRPVPLTWTASGRLLVSGLSADEIMAFIPTEDFLLPGGRDLAPKTFLAQVSQASSEGFFFCDSVIDGFTSCYAAAIRDQSGACLATLCLVVPRDEVKRRHNELHNTLLGFAARLNGSLGEDT